MSEAARGNQRVARARAEAAEELRHAAEWIANGGPLAYDLGEARHHIDRAGIAMRAAERGERLARRGK